MCIIAFAWKTGTEKLILAANRDEFFHRPAKKASFWDDGQTLGGIDLQHGGSWLAINRSGRFAALTNYRDPAGIDIDAPSRGCIVTDFVKGSDSPQRYTEKILSRSPHFNGFNLLMMEEGRLSYFSNISRKLKVLEPGVYGLSNHLLDTPWPKTQRVKNGLQALLDRNAMDHDALLQLLSDRKRASDDELPDTGVPKDFEKALSSVFISTDGYGTRCSTIVTVSNDRKVDFTEVSFDYRGNVTGREKFKFSISSMP